MTVLVALCALLPAAGGAGDHWSVASSRAELIAFEKYRPGNFLATEIWLMNSDGTNQRRLTRGCCFDWSPDGKKIAFLRAEERGGIYSINTDGTGLRRLTQRGTDSLGRPVDWSPDGRKLAFAQKAAIFVIKANGTGEHRISSLDKNRGIPSTAGDPRWSPNARKIVFDRYQYGLPHNGPDIVIVNVDGTGEAQVTNDYSSDDPSWSPGGRRIVFISSRGVLGYDVFADSDVYVMNSDGSEQKDITNTPELSEGNPSWSPGGARILLRRGGVGGIDTIKPDGRRHRNLTRGTKYSRRTLGPQWSSDGQKIVFAHFDHAWNIVEMTASGRYPTQLTRFAKPDQARSPAWQP